MSCCGVRPSSFGVRCWVCLVIEQRLLRTNGLGQVCADSDGIRAWRQGLSCRYPIQPRQRYLESRKRHLCILSVAGAPGRYRAPGLPWRSARGARQTWLSRPKHSGRRQHHLRDPTPPATAFGLRRSIRRTGAREVRKQGACPGQFPRNLRELIPKVDLSFQARLAALVGHGPVFPVNIRRFERELGKSI